MITPRPAPYIEFDDKALRVLGDQVGVDQRAQVIEVGGQGIEFLDEIGVAGLLIVHQVRAAGAALVVADVDLDTVTLLGQGRAAEGGLELHAVVAGGIVGGRDHHAGDGAIVVHRKRNGRRRRIGLGQQDRESIGGQHTRHLSRKTIGEEARIEADDDPVRIGLRAAVAGFVPMLGGNRVGDGLGQDAQIVEGEGI